MVSHYRILESIGEGGMGVVYKAEDTRLGRFVAIKFMPPEMAANQQAVDRFQREARAASALNHPNICMLLDVGGPADQPFLVMELLEGQPLGQRISNRPMPAAEIVELGTQIADALEAAHAKGIVHRDVKPANLFVTRRGQAKILDFGVAKLTGGRQSLSAGQDESTAKIDDKLTSAGAAIGTYAYMSPEQALGQDVDARSDLFSLGIVLYEMATGALPFAGANTVAALDAILHKDPTPPAKLNADLPDGLEAIILKALEKDREVRYQTAADIRADLKRLARNSGTMSTAGSRPAEPPPAAIVAKTEPKPSLPRWIWGAAAAVLIAGGAGAWFFTHRARPVTAKDTIVLADFTNATGDPVFDETLKHALAAQLEQSPYLNILSESRVRETMKLMGRSADERVTNSIAREVCQRNAFKAMLTGTIAAVGKGFSIAVDAVNCSTGDPVAREQVEAEDKDHVLKALGKAATEMRGRLGESLSSIQKLDAPIEQATTPSLEAFQAYALGDAQREKGAEMASVPFFERAIQIDPNFALAYGVLGVIYNNQGEQNRSKEYFTKAMALIDRVSEREKLYLRSHYYMEVTRETDKATETLELMKRTFPRDHSAPVNLSVIYSVTGQPEKSVAEARAAMEVDPSIHTPYLNLASGLAELGRLDEAKTIAAQALAKGLAGPRIHSLLYDIAYLQGDQAEMARQGQWGLEHEDFGTLGQQANIAFSLGQLRKAAELEEKATDIANRQKLAGVVAAFRASRLDVAATYGSCEIVRKVENPEKEFAAGGSATLAGVAGALALCGENAKAEKLADELYKECPTDTLQNATSLPAIHAVVALNAKQPAHAIELLKSAVPYEGSSSFTPYLRGLAYLKAGSGPEAAAQFEKVLNLPGRSRLSSLYPLSMIGLARAAALSGDKGKARKAYQDFLALWKDADPDIPLLAEVKKEYAALQ